MSKKYTYKPIKTKSKRFKKPDDDNVLLRTGVCLLIAIVYSCIMRFFCRTAYSDVLYFESMGADIAIGINVFIIILFISFDKSFYCWFFKKTKRAIIAAFVVAAFALYPLLFSNIGTIADETSIQKKNIFGNTTEEYLYSDIESVRMLSRHGIEYDITFDDGETLDITSQSLPVFNQFSNGENLIKFDKLMDGYADKEIYIQEMYEWRTEYNYFRRRCFFDEKTARYFEQQFKNKN